MRSNRHSAASKACQATSPARPEILWAARAAERVVKVEPNSAPTTAPTRATTADPMTRAPGGPNFAKAWRAQVNVINRRPLSIQSLDRTLQSRGAGGAGALDGTRTAPLSGQCARGGSAPALAGLALAALGMGHFDCGRSGRFIPLLRAWQTGSRFAASGVYPDKILLYDLYMRTAEQQRR